VADRGNFPRPYVNSVPNEGESKIMEYVDFDKLGYGGRKSAMPKSTPNGIKSLEHVGMSAEGGKGKK
jgi:hypothetical protein